MVRFLWKFATFQTISQHCKRAFVVSCGSVPTSKKPLFLCVLFRIIRGLLKKKRIRLQYRIPLNKIGASARQLVAHLACIIRTLVRTSSFSSFGVIAGTSSGKSRLSSESYPLRWDSLLGAVFFSRLLPFSFCLLSYSFFLLLRLKSCTFALVQYLRWAVVLLLPRIMANNSTHKTPFASLKLRFHNYTI